MTTLNLEGSLFVYNRPLATEVGYQETVNI